MPCQDASKMMSLAIDKRLSAAEQLEFEAHLAECESCRDEWAYMRRMNALLAGAKRVQPPPGFTAHVMARIQQRLLWRSILRGGSLVFIFSLLVAISFSSVVIAISPALDPFVRTPLLASIIAFFERSNGLVLTCSNALHAILSAAFNSNYPFIIVGYLMVAVVLLIWWTRVLLVPRLKSSVVNQRGDWEGQSCP
ncbi:MAG: anti-sigma factor family protein [Anaerolineae bacterium]